MEGIRRRPSDEDGLTRETSTVRTSLDSRWMGQRLINAAAVMGSDFNFGVYFKFIINLRNAVEMVVADDGPKYKNRRKNIIVTLYVPVFRETSWICSEQRQIDMQMSLRVSYREVTG